MVLCLSIILETGDAKREEIFLGCKRFILIIKLKVNSQYWAACIVEESSNPFCIIHGMSPHLEGTRCFV